MQAMANSERAKELSCIANNMEKYISFSLGNLKFIDSCAFMAASLDSLVKATPKESLKITRKLADELSPKNFDLLVQKEVNPYEYMDSLEKFAETSLPPKESFHSTLTGEGIGEKDLEHGQAVWEAFGFKNLGDYHDVYMQTDVALLADVFENFRSQQCVRAGPRRIAAQQAHHVPTILAKIIWDTKRITRLRCTYLKCIKMTSPVNIIHGFIMLL